MENSPIRITVIEEIAIKKADEAIDMIGDVGLQEYYKSNQSGLDRIELEHGFYMALLKFCGNRLIEIKF